MSGLFCEKRGTVVGVLESVFLMDGNTVAITSRTAVERVYRVEWLFSRTRMGSMVFMVAVHKCH